MNSITVAGTIGKDSEIRHLTSGDSVCNFSVADNQGGKDKQPIWWSCSLFGKRAESLSQYLIKGQQVAISGTLTKRVWNDKQGVEREVLEMRVNDLTLMGSKSTSQNPSPTTQQQQSTPQKKQHDVKADFDDDIPF